MNASIPNAIVRAAEARAQGNSWPAAAAGWSLAGLRKWVRQHQAAWARELGIARRDARDAACDEAVAMLRMQLRAKEEKTILLAATALAKQLVPSGKKPAKADGHDANDFMKLLEEVPPDRFTRVDKHLQACEEAMKDAEAN